MKKGILEMKRILAGMVVAALGVSMAVAADQQFSL